MTAWPSFRLPKRARGSKSACSPRNRTHTDPSPPDGVGEARLVDIDPAEPLWENAPVKTTDISKDVYGVVHNRGPTKLAGDT